MRPPPRVTLARCLLLFASGAAAQPSAASPLIAFGAALKGANTGALSTWTGSNPCSGSAWQGVWCNNNAVSRVRVGSLMLNGTISCDIANISTLTILDLSDNQLTGSIPSCLFNLTSLVALDVSRNWLTGPLPVLPSTYPTGSPGQLFFSVFDNQFLGTIPSTYTRLRAFAVAMNPGVYGPWPANLEPAQFTLATGGLCQNTGAPWPWDGGNGYGTNGWVKGTYSGGMGNAFGWNYPDCCDCPMSPRDRTILSSLSGPATYGVQLPFPPTAAQTGSARVGQILFGLYTGWYPTYGTGFHYGTSIGLDEPLYAILRRIAAALDPTGSLLPSWQASSTALAQPCLPSFGGGQRSTSPGYGQSWVGVAAYCIDGTYAGNPLGGNAAHNPGGANGWMVGSHLTQWATGGIGQIGLTGLGLNGTLPADIRLLRTMTYLDLSQNSLQGSIPAAWGQPVTFTNYPALSNFTSGPNKRSNSTQQCATLGVPLLLRIDLSRNSLSGACLYTRARSQAA